MKKHLFKNNILKSKVALSMLATFVLSFIIVLLISFLYMRDSAISSRKEGLQILANEKARQVNAFIDSQKEKSRILSSMIVFRELAKEPKNKDKLTKAKAKITEMKSMLPGISVLTNDGIVIIGENDLPGTDYSKSMYFSLPEKRINFEQYYDSVRKKDFYVVAAPLYDPVDGKKIVGTIGFDLELDKLNKIMEEPVESRTNEVYLLDRNHLLLSASEYVGKGNRNGILIQEVNSEGAEECYEDLEEFQDSTSKSIEEHEESVPDYLNYVGDEVFGAHAYVPEIGGCILSEESVEEIRGY